jgi:hypothetical protein
LFGARFAIEPATAFRACRLDRRTGGRLGSFPHVRQARLHYNHPGRRFTWFGGEAQATRTPSNDHAAIADVVTTTTKTTRLLA